MNATIIAPPPAPESAKLAKLRKEITGTARALTACAARAEKAEAEARRLSAALKRATTEINALRAALASLGAAR